MSLGRRIAQRGKGAIIVSLASTPREPLLFLYPRWIRKLSTASSIPHTENTTEVDETLQETYAIERERESPQSSGINRYSSKVGSPAYYDKITGSPAEAESYIQKKVRLVLQSRVNAESTALRAHQLRQHYQDKRRREREASLPDWRAILGDLIEYTPKVEKWLDNAVNILIPESALGVLLYGVDSHIWDIQKRRGCSIELKSRDENQDGQRVLVLSGPAVGISKAASDILQAAPNAVLRHMVKEIPSSIAHQSQPTNPSSLVGATVADEIQNPRLRNVLSENRQRILLTQDANEVAQPEEWTKTSFLNYVQYLTSAEIPNHMHRLMYDTRKDHITTVVGILRKIFKDPQCESSISRTAFNRAMAYFIKTNRIEDARCLFVLMDMIKLKMDVETFNIMLRGAAKFQDLSNFHFILRLMLRRSLSPNADTFVSFMKAFSDRRIKLYILSVMKQKGLLNHKSTIKNVCEELVTEEIEDSLNNNQTERDFLAHMDSRYGPDWLTVSSGNKILHALGSRGLISRCWDFLFEMEARFITPNKVSINTVLNHCKQMKNLRGAIEILGNLPSNCRFQLDQMAYHALFEMAWRGRRYNVARVVWRYACLSATTTSRMRMLVSSSLRGAVKEPGIPSSGQRWLRSFGLFLIGNSPLGKHPMAVLPEVLGMAGPTDPSHNARQTPLRLSTLTASSSDVTSQTGIHETAGSREKMEHRNLLQLLNRDHEVFQDWVPSKPFPVMLAMAWERDEDWRRPGVVNETKALEWMLDRAVFVPLHVRRFPDTFEWR